MKLSRSEVVRNMATILTHCHLPVLSWSQKFAWSTDEIAVEEWLEVVPYDSRGFHEAFVLYR